MALYLLRVTTQRRPHRPKWYDMAACCVTTRRFPKQVAEIVFCLPFLNYNVIAHECCHATWAWAERSGWKERGLEEKMATYQGWITAQVLFDLKNGGFVVRD